MIRTQISFDADLYERAKQAARRECISLAELCRRSVAEAIAPRRAESRPWASFIGSIDGVRDDSARVNAVVYDREAPGERLVAVVRERLKGVGDAR